MEPQILLSTDEYLRQKKIIKKLKASIFILVTIGCLVALIVLMKGC